MTIKLNFPDSLILKNRSLNLGWRTSWCADFFSIEEGSVIQITGKEGDYGLNKKVDRVSRPRPVNRFSSMISQ